MLISRSAPEGSAEQSHAQAHLEHALGLMAKMRAAGAPPDFREWGALLDAYSRSGDLDGARRMAADGVARGELSSDSQVGRVGKILHTLVSFDGFFHNSTIPQIK